MTDSDPSSAYELGKQHGYEECKNEMKDVIESMVYEIARFRFPKQYDYSDEQIQSIMSEYGFKE